MGAVGYNPVFYNIPPLPDENTRSKFLFYGGQNCLNPDVGLERYIPPEIIPDFLGGPCEVSETRGMLRKVIVPCLFYIIDLILVWVLTKLLVRYLFFRSPSLSPCVASL